MTDFEEPASGGTTALVRVFAPLALGAVAVVVVILVASSLENDDQPAPRDGRDGDRTEQVPRQRSAPDTYVVEPGDSLSGIAARFDLPVERLQRLNPDVDPQALAAGERLRLRRR